MKKKRKTKLKIKRLFILLIFISLIVCLVIFIPKQKEKKKIDSKLVTLGYSEKEIDKISKLSSDEISLIEKSDYNDKLISIITSKSYNNKNLELYLKYIDDEVNDDIISFINQKYYINDFLDRYIKYKDKNNDLDYEEIVKRVNSNLDYTFYEDSNKADTSKGMYTLVNKYYYLDQNYVPEDLVQVEAKYTMNNTYLNKTAYEFFKKMASAASGEGLTLLITTAYRNYNFQATLYNNYVRADGVEKADTYSARPGYSEHQLGYSTDLTNKELVDFGEFKDTKEYKWLKKNAYKYGFIIRYTDDNQYITGYVPEAWHYRYVGEDIAKYIYENNITYEEYYAYFLR